MSNSFSAQCTYAIATYNVPPSSLSLQPQYVFIHDALCELITCGETDVAAPALKVKIQRLSKVIPGKGVTGFQEQFQVYTGPWGNMIPAKYVAVDCVHRFSSCVCIVLRVYCAVCVLCCVCIVLCVYCAVCIVLCVYCAVCVLCCVCVVLCVYCAVCVLHMIW